MSIALFFVLAILVAAVIAQPLLPGSRSSYPLPAARGRAAPRRESRPVPASHGPICPGCEAPVRAGDRFCVRCGTALAGERLTPACASCGASLGEDDCFCRRCGVAVAGKEVQQ